MNKGRLYRRSVYLPVVEIKTTNIGTISEQFRTEDLANDYVQNIVDQINRNQ